MQEKFAPIVPPQLLPTLKSEGHLGSYNLLLVQEVLEHQEIYQEVFKDYESFNILDNGVVETGKAFDAEQMFKAAVACNARVVILPDVIEDTNATLSVVKATG